MKTIYRNAVAASVAAAAMLSAGSAHAASATADARAEILSAVTVQVQNGSVLDFGQIAASTSPSTVTIDAQTGLTCGSTLVCVGTNSAVFFDVTGTPGVAVAVTVPSTATTLSNGAGGTMTLNNFNQYAPSYTLDTAGELSFAVGGVLNVGANQAAGVYTGTFNVTVDY